MRDLVSKTKVENDRGRHLTLSSGLYMHVTCTHMCTEQCGHIHTSQKETAGEEPSLTCALQKYGEPAATDSTATPDKVVVRGL